MVRDKMSVTINH